MNKQEALKKIEELKEFVENYEDEIERTDNILIVNQKSILDNDFITSAFSHKELDNLSNNSQVKKIYETDEVQIFHNKVNTYLYVRVKK